ncbi:helix-turn-helix domain-containing protein [Labrys monachus]|uniref:Transcriptional regulator with XRE-family HTH domain n=1 Tax=Labrys monachus TaxID=217067 RepID=A0ABU0FE59_9HYPH|nr:helix-turn-helix transcriptional regulator [Labrys monachus]MDQ0392716.1 transcriptional regulator with XRE-family HTH domain [Labrys monachus]
MGFKNPTLVQIDWNKFGHDIRSRREGSNLTVRQLQKLTGVSYGTIARIERADCPCGADVFITLALWIGSDPQAYLLYPTSRRSWPSAASSARPSAG